MECLAALAGLNMLGALISSTPANSIAVFERVYSTSSETILLRSGDSISPGLSLIAIHSRKKVTLRCSGETFDYFFWSLNRATVNPDFVAPEPENLPDPEPLPPPDEPILPIDL